MRVLAVPMDDGACNFFRISEPARAAREQGVDVAVTSDLQVKAEHDPNGYCTVFEFHHDVDVLVLQRPVAQNVHAVAVAAKRQGVKLIVELDDDLWKAHKNNTVAPFMDPRRFPLHNNEWARKTVEMADALIVSTPALTRVAPDKSHVVRNRLPERCLDTRPAVSPAGGVLGWTGHIGVHPEDLQDTRGAVRRVGAPLRVVGSEFGVSAALRANPGQVSLGHPWVQDMATYWQAVVDNIGVGIAPLQTSEFNRAKSWLKPAEYTALGIPWVASPLPEYVALAADSGAGLIAKGQSGWYQGMRAFLDGGAEYDLARERGAEWSAKNTLEEHIWEWITVWEKVAAL